MANNFNVSSEKNTRKLIIFGGGIILLILFGVGLDRFPIENYSISPKTRAFIQSLEQNQPRIEEDIQTYYENGSYSFDNPLIVQNPYGTAPLTALLVFDSPEDLQISIHIHGKTPQAAIDFTFDGFRKHHEIPVYGLYADYLNLITLTGKNYAGESSESSVELKTEPLPVYLDRVKIIKADPICTTPE